MKIEKSNEDLLRLYLLSLEVRRKHPMTAQQIRADRMLSSFAEHATDGYTLAAMVGGGLVYRLGRLGILAAGSHLLTPYASPLTSHLLRLTSVGIGFTGEVFAFEAGQRALRIGIGGADPNLLRSTGENGLGRGLLGAAMTLGPLKAAGVFALNQNIVVQHLFQDSAMVLAHNIADRIFTGRGEVTSPGRGDPAPTIAEQFINAEATLWQMNAGMSLVHGAFPTLGQLDRSLDLSIRSRVGASLGAPSHGWAQQAAPLRLEEMILATLGTSPKLRPPLEDAPQLWMAKKDDEKLSPKPSSGGRQSNLLFFPSLKAKDPTGERKGNAVSEKEGNDWEALFDPHSQEGQIETFLFRWAAGAKISFSRDQSASLQRELDRLPSYFRQQLAYYTVAEPLFAKLVMMRLGLLSPDSPLLLDPQFQSEMTQQCGKVFDAEELSRLGEELIYNFEWAAGAFFPESFRPLSGAERDLWHRKISDLPPVFLKTLTKGGMPPAQILFLLHGFGLSDLGFPEQAQLSIKP